MVHDNSLLFMEPPEVVGISVFKGTSVSTGIGLHATAPELLHEHCDLHCNPGEVQRTVEECAEISIYSNSSIH